jgi:hypothetical protein
LKIDPSVALNARTTVSQSRAAAFGISGIAKTNGTLADTANLPAANATGTSTNEEAERQFAGVKSLRLVHTVGRNVAGLSARGAAPGATGGPDARF